MSMMFAIVNMRGNAVRLDIFFVTLVSALLIRPEYILLCRSKPRVAKGDSILHDPRVKGAHRALYDSADNYGQS